MKEIDGDLLVLANRGDFTVIIHGCNCFHTMGAGIAKSIKEKYPEAYEADLQTNYGDKNKLGDYSFFDYPNFTIINAYTQYMYGRGKQVDYDAVRKCFNKIKKKFGMKMGRSNKFGIPKIGAGLAGGNWDIISGIIEDEMVGEDITVVNFVEGK
jgi:O-acetyl-ADP-ribose deacetylase (regulator of RNase III)